MNIICTVKIIFARDQWLFARRGAPPPSNPKALRRTLICLPLIYIISVLIVFGIGLSIACITIYD